MLVVRACHFTHGDVGGAGLMSTYTLWPSVCPARQRWSGPRSRSCRPVRTAPQTALTTARPPGPRHQRAAGRPGLSAPLAPADGGGWGPEGGVVRESMGCLRQNDRPERQKANKANTVCVRHGAMVPWCHGAWAVLECRQRARVVTWVGQPVPAAMVSLLQRRPPRRCRRSTAPSSVAG